MTKRNIILSVIIALTLLLAGYILYRGFFAGGPDQPDLLGTSPEEVAPVAPILSHGSALDFDGTDDEADAPDTATLSFGDGAVDQPLSIVVLCKPDANNALMTLVGKLGSATLE